MMEKFVTKVRSNAKSNVNRTRKTLTEIEHLQSSRLVITLLLVLPNFKLFQLEKKDQKSRFICDTPYHLLSLIKDVIRNDDLKGTENDWRDWIF